MQEKKLNNLFVSVTLPLARDADPELLRICLRSLESQTYGNFEVLTLVSNGSPPEILRIAKDFPFVRVFGGNFNKSAARNFLAEQARGEYMMYIDVDMELSPSVLEDCVALVVEEKSLAIINPKEEADSKSFWSRCRALERELIAADPGSASPDFLHLATFRGSGGFDEELDLLDDWALSLSLQANGVRFDWAKSPIFTRETTNLAEMFRRKLRRGRLIPALLRKFPDAPQPRFVNRFVGAYLRNWNLLLASPFLTLGLGLLKTWDMLALSIGRLSPARPASHIGADAYLKTEIADTYDQIRLGDNFHLYKHFAEIRSLIKLLGKPNSRLLEVGSGTGRITQELVNRGFRMLPTEPSPAMIRQFLIKPSLPQPVIASGMAIPFDGNHFESAYSLRVIWHLSSPPEVALMLSELARVTTHSVVLDISNERRWRNSWMRMLATAYFGVRPCERESHETSQLFTAEKFSMLAERSGLFLEAAVPLDVLSPIWLRLLPKGAAKALFPMLYRIEQAIWKVIPPGRLLIRMTKIPTNLRGKRIKSVL